MIGTILGGYRLITELGSGGMGTVYYGEHLVIGRRAAIKLLRPEVSKNHEVVSRFLTEARTVNDIRHPNVVEITDLGREGDHYFIVMDLLEGETLGERIDRDGKLEERSVIRICRQVASALGTAHDRGVVHRDLKPENIFLTNHPEYPDYVKVLDFGIAKLIGEGTKVSHHTEAGVLLGTPAYMSPEQCRGQVELDHRSDVYSLGIVMYEMLTGHPPFVGPALGQILIAHVTEPVTPPVDRNAAISPRINAAIMRALEKDPAKRFPTMREFRDAIEEPKPLTVDPGAAALVEKQDKKEKREAKFVNDKLTEIIMRRIAEDRLVLPSMPGIAIECMQVLKDPKQTFGTVSAVIGKDPLLASRILRLANSAAFPSRVPATTLEQAVARMGTEGLTMALVKLSLHDAFSSRNDRIKAAFKGIWEHSLAVALIARDLCQSSIASGAMEVPEPGAVYLAGLLHDVGKPVVGALLLEAERMLADDGSVAWMNESVWKRVVNESHRQVGFALAHKWNIPDQIGRAIEQCRDYEKGTPRCTANFVRLANALAKREGLYVGEVDERDVYDAIGAGRTMLGLDEAALKHACRELFPRVGTLVEGPNEKEKKRKAS